MPIFCSEPWGYIYIDLRINALWGTFILVVFSRPRWLPNRMHYFLHFFVEPGYSPFHRLHNGNTKFLGNQTDKGISGEMRSSELGATLGNPLPLPVIRTKAMGQKSGVTHIPTTTRLGKYQATSAPDYRNQKITHENTTIYYNNYAIRKTNILRGEQDQLLQSSSPSSAPVLHGPQISNICAAFSFNSSAPFFTTSIMSGFWRPAQ